MAAIEHGAPMMPEFADRNPLDDLATLRDVQHVMCYGQDLENPRAKHILELDAELALIMELPVA